MLVIGMGNLGRALVRRLVESGAEVVAIDKDEARLNEVKDIVDAAYVMDAANFDALKELNIDSFDSVVIAIGEHFEAILLSAFHCKNMGAKRLIVRANNEHQKQILTQIGIKDVINPEEEIGKEIAEMILHPTITDSIQLSEAVELITVLAPPGMIGQKVSTIRKAAMEKDLFFVTLRRKNNDGTFTIYPPSRLSDSLLVQEGDELILLGEKQRIYQFTE